jgi:hypothetical protein
LALGETDERNACKKLLGQTGGPAQIQHQTLAVKGFAVPEKYRRQLGPRDEKYSGGRLETMPVGADMAVVAGGVGVSVDQNDFLTID